MDTININRKGKEEYEVFGLTSERAQELHAIRPSDDAPELQEGEQGFAVFLSELVANAKTPEEFAYLLFQAGKTKQIGDVIQQMQSRQMEQMVTDIKKALGQN